MYKVKFAQLYESTHVAGIGDLGKTLPPTNKTVPGLEVFVLDDKSLQLNWGTPGNEKTAFIPSPSVKIIVLEKALPGPTKPSPAAQKKPEPPKAA